MSKCLSENRYFRKSEAELINSELNKINQLNNKWKDLQMQLKTTKK